MPADWYTFVAVLLLAAFAVFLIGRLSSSAGSRARKFDTTIASDPRVIGKAKWYALTPRQQQVARMVARGWSNSEIAQQLGIKSNTVDAHLRKVYSVMQVHSRTELSYLIRDYVD